MDRCVVKLLSCTSKAQLMLSHDIQFQSLTATHVAKWFSSFTSRCVFFSRTDHRHCATSDVNQQTQLGWIGWEKDPPSWIVRHDDALDINITLIWYFGPRAGHRARHSAESAETIKVPHHWNLFQLFRSPRAPCTASFSQLHINSKASCMEMKKETNRHVMQSPLRRMICFTFAWLGRWKMRFISCRVFMWLELMSLWCSTDV